MKISDQVRRILANNIQARNSDRELLLAYMEIEGMELSPKQKEIFRHMPSMETIRRIRQKLQEGGQYLANKNIAAERTFKSYSMQQNAPIAKPETLERIIEQPFTQQAISWLDKDDL